MKNTVDKGIRNVVGNSLEVVGLIAYISFCMGIVYFQGWWGLFWSIVLFFIAVLPATMILEELKTGPVDYRSDSEYHAGF